MSDPLTPSGPARRLRCHVIAGFPERGVADNGEVCAYNSTCIVSDDGTLLAVHRKRHMYPPADDLWVTPGSEWRILDLKIARDKMTKERRTVRCCPGICMDVRRRSGLSSCSGLTSAQLNSDRFEAELDRFELTGFAADNGAEMMLFSMAWLTGEASELPPAPDDDDDGEWEQVKSTLSYWAMRCRPLWERQAPAVFVACNRVGTELGTGSLSRVVEAG